jgi:hypothetical protein
VVKKNFYENPLPREWREWLDELDRDPEHQRQLAEQQAGYDYFRREWEGIRERFVARFIALNSSGVVADAAELESLLAELERLEIPLHDIVIEYVFPPDAELIL